MTQGIRVRLAPASDVSAASITTIAATEPPAHLRTSFSIGRDQFARVWRFSIVVEGVAHYDYLGDWSSTFPGKWNQVLERIVESAADLSAQLGERRPATSPITSVRSAKAAGFHPRKSLARLPSH